MTNEEWEQILNDEEQQEIMEPIWAYTLIAALVCVLFAMGTVAGIYWLWKVATT